MHKNQHLRKMSAVGLSLEMSPFGVNNGATLPSEGQWGWNVGWGWISQHWLPLTLCSSCPTCKSSEQSSGHNSFYCFGQGKGFFACKHSKKTCVWLPSKWSVWHLWVNERAALALELDFKTQNLERNVANVMLPKPPLMRIYIKNDPVELQHWMVLQFSRMELCLQPRAT